MRPLCKSGKHKLQENTLFQNGRHLSVLLFACKLALVASFKGENILLNFEFKNEATRANLKANKIPLKGHFGIRCI